MGIYTGFDLHLPEDLHGALDQLAQSKSNEVQVFAGGTNLMVDLRAKRCKPKQVIGISKLQELRGIDCGSKRITIGSATTVSDLLHSADIAIAAPSLRDAAKRFAGQMVRNVATVAGNIACGSPAVDEYYLGYKKDARRPDELISQVSWPRLPANSSNVFYKVARREGDAITIMGIAVTLSVAGGKCTKARIALGAVGPMVLRAKKAEAMLEGKELTAAIIAAATAQAVEECSPIDDIRATAEYRLHTVQALTQRLVSQAWEQLKKTGE
jgi:carbon-monoxide dehydrogenase medium subunit